MPKESKSREALRPGRLKLAAIQRRLTEEKVEHIRTHTLTRAEAIAGMERLVRLLEGVVGKNAAILPWRFPPAGVKMFCSTPAMLHAELKEHCLDLAWSVKLIALPGED